MGNNISSAEMTAYWRSLEPLLSGDGQSVNLASLNGIQNTKAFEEKLNYTLIGRLIGVRAGYFLRQAIQILSSGKYDSCISFASGFSLLNYYIANYFIKKPIKFYDTDLSHIIDLRQERLNRIRHMLDNEVLNNIQQQSFDLEQLVNKTISLKQSFSAVSRPLVLLEGISYYLTPACIEELLRNLLDYFEVAVILDYFPDDAAQRSKFFSKNSNKLNQFMPETIKAVINDKKIGFRNGFNIIDHSSVQSIEAELCKSNCINPKLVDENDFFPTQLITIQKFL